MEHVFCFQGSATSVGGGSDQRVCSFSTNIDENTDKKAGWTSWVSGYLVRTTQASATGSTLDSDAESTDTVQFVSTIRGGGKGRWDWLRPGRKAHAKKTLEKAMQRAEAKRPGAAEAAQAEESGGQGCGALPTGLANQGNTCYLNSLLQSLYHAPGLKEAVLEATDAAEDGEEDGPTLAGLSEVFRQLDEGRRCVHCCLCVSRTHLNVVH